MKDRIFPQTILIGDTVRVQFNLPTAPDGETWNAASLRMRRVRDTEVTVLVESGTLTDQMAEVEITAAETTPMADGAYRYWLAITSDMGTVRTIEAGVSVIADPLDPQKNYEETMVEVLRTVILTRAQETGEVSRYIIGDRDVTMMSNRELEVMLGDYESKVRRQRRPGGKIYSYRRRIKV